MALKFQESLLMTSDQWPEPSEDAPRVAVIGAGVAGLTAARRLSAHGVHVTIFEARDRIGGRTHTDESWGVPIDLGASWIHGTKGNPLAKFARKLGIEVEVSDSEAAALYDQDGELDDESRYHLLERVDGMYDWIEALNHRHPKGKPDISVATAMASDLTRQGGPPDDMVVLDLGMQWLAMDEGIELGKLSLLAYEDDDPYEGPDELLLKGYAPLVERLADGLSIELGSPVERVTWGDGEVALQLQGVEGERRFDCALVTAPLGVLQAGKITFEPALPEWKQESLDRLGAGMLNKLVLRFEEAFWPKDAHFVAKLTEPHRWAAWMLNLERVTGQPILMGFVPGDQARDYERLSDEENVEMALEDLRAIYGDLPALKDYKLTRWGSDPWSLGAYVYCPVGARGEDIDTLGEPVGRWLFFGGEATDEDNLATVTGAFCSGLREADRILEAWFSSKPEPEADHS